MKPVIVAVCFALSTSFAFAQDKDAEKKAPAATAPPEAPKGAQVATEKVKGSTMATETSPKGDQVQKEPSAKQKARQVKRECEKEAKAKKLKGDERRQFINECIAK